MPKVTLYAPDAAGLRFALERYLKNVDLLPRERRNGVFATGGNTDFVQDYSVYGTAEAAIVRGGSPYPTPEWMIEPDAP